MPGFTTAALRAQVAIWTDGDGLNNTGSAQFAEMSVGVAVNFSIALSETMWASTGGGSWGQASNWTNSVPAAGSIDYGKCTTRVGFFPRLASCKS